MSARRRLSRIHASVTASEPINSRGSLFVSGAGARGGAMARSDCFLMALPLGELRPSVADCAGTSFSATGEFTSVGGGSQSLRRSTDTHARALAIVAPPGATTADLGVQRHRTSPSSSTIRRFSHATPPLIDCDIARTWFRCAPKTTTRSRLSCSSTSVRMALKNTRRRLRPSATAVAATTMPSAIQYGSGRGMWFPFAIASSLHASAALGAA